jgi:hypothetical protein
LRFFTIEAKQVEPASFDDESTRVTVQVSRT